MQLSFVIPAYNEARYIQACVESIRASLAATSVPTTAAEIIVADNNSTDATAELAEAAGAQVVFEELNQISRARNAGAGVATGEWLVFIDADSVLNPGLLQDVLELIDSQDYVGCGCLFTMQDLAFWPRQTVALWSRLSVWKCWAAGSFVVCRRDVFVELGGFSLDLYAAEEIDLSRRLKKWAAQHGLQFGILTQHPLETSNRKMHLYSSIDQLKQLVRLVLMPRRALRDPRHLGLWYGGRR